MSSNPQLLRPASTTSPPDPIPSPAPAPPRLWPHLQSLQRRQLAQCLAELIRRQRQSTLSATEETPHEPS